jgi:hypothetical protein
LEIESILRRLSLIARPLRILGNCMVYREIKESQINVFREDVTHIFQQMSKNPHGENR